MFTKKGVKSRFFTFENRVSFLLTFADEMTKEELELKITAMEGRRTFAEREWFGNTLPFTFLHE